MIFFFLIAFLFGRSLRRKSKEEPDREARPGTHLDEDDDEKKAKSFSKWVMLCSTVLAETVLGRGLGAASAPQSSGRFPWSPLGVVTACLSLSVQQACLLL